MDYRVQRLKEDLTNAQQRNKKQRIQLSNYKKVHERDLEIIKNYKEVIDKAIELNKQVIKDTKEFYRPTKDIIYSGDTLIDIAEQNLKILKEVE